MSDYIMCFIRFLQGLLAKKTEKIRQRDSRGIWTGWMNHEMQKWLQLIVDTIRVHLHQKCLCIRQGFSPITFRGSLVSSLEAWNKWSIVLIRLCFLYSTICWCVKAYYNLYYPTTKVSLAHAEREPPSHSSCPLRSRHRPFDRCISDFPQLISSTSPTSITG